MSSIGELKFYERHDNHLLGSSTRRVGDNAWVRLNELILPNFTQAGAAYAADGTKPRYFGRSAFTRWVVPVDDENAIAYAWGNFGERGDPHEYNSKEGCELIEQGEIMDRSPEERQRHPGDCEGDYKERLTYPLPIPIFQVSEGRSEMAKKHLVMPTAKG